MTATATTARTVHVEECMGTVFTIDIRDDGRWGDAVGDVTEWLHRVDRIFSTYKPTSDISRLQRRELTIREADPLVAEVFERCVTLEKETEGWFTMRSPEGLDPTGLVKGWAIEHASAILRAHGSGHHAVNGGGDMQLAGGPTTGESWGVGIADPFSAAHVATVVAVRDLAVATSGTSERGHHIRNPFTGKPAVGVASATVVGPSLTNADCYATAAVARGERSIDWLANLRGYEAFLVTAEGDRLYTPGFVALIA